MAVGVIKIVRSKRLRIGGNGCVEGRRWFYEARLQAGTWVMNGWSRDGVLRAAQAKRNELQAQVPAGSDFIWRIEETWPAEEGTTTPIAEPIADDGKRHCSICRGYHGTEVQHACE